MTHDLTTTAVGIANRLAEWIDRCPLPPEELRDVYAAHVLLTELIRAEHIALQSHGGLPLRTVATTS